MMFTTGNFLDIYSGWDFTDISPIDIFSAGWYSEKSIPKFNVYFGGWNNPSEILGIYNFGWFSDKNVDLMFLNNSDIRDIKSVVNLKSHDILITSENTGININNVGSW